MAVCCATVVDPKKQNYNNIFLAKKPVEPVFCCNHKMIGPRKLQQNSKNVCFIGFFVKANFVESSLFLGPQQILGQFGPRISKIGAQICHPKATKLHPNCPKQGKSQSNCPQIAPSNRGKFTKLPPKCKEYQPNCPPNCPKLAPK